MNVLRLGMILNSVGDGVVHNGWGGGSLPMWG